MVDAVSSGTVAGESGVDWLCFVLKQNEAREESTRKGVNQCSKHVTQTQQQRPESPTVTLTRDARKHRVQGTSSGVFMYLVFTCIPGESYRKRKRLERLLTPLCADFVSFCSALIFSKFILFNT